MLDADRFARDALAPGTAATQAVIGRYGPSVCADNPPGPLSALDRAALARIVFAEEHERRWLEQLIHPIVRTRLLEEMAQLQGVPVLILMVPLLYETGFEDVCSEVWVVECGGEAEQRRRLIARDGLTPEAAQARLRAQWPMAEKVARADVVIHNCGSQIELSSQLDAALAAPAPPHGSQCG